MRNSLFSFLLVISSSVSIFGQNLPSLIIDNVSTQFSEISLPYWLKAGQTINIGTNAQSVSILEFTVNESNLMFSQTIALKNEQTVPANKVWKIEAIGLKSVNTAIPSSTFIGSGSSTSSSTTSLPTIFQSPKKFETPGTFSWTVPPGVTSICVETWGGGGGGGSANSNVPIGSGGGGGGYAYECFSVLPGTIYSVVVGFGGGGGSGTWGNSGSNGQASRFGDLVNATGGSGGSGGVGGAGGTSMNSFKADGGAGGNAGIGGNGGNGGNGGSGGYGSVYQSNGNPGVIPGGGGSGANIQHVSGTRDGGAGARGQVYIYW
jgi:hypothetical protein